MPGVYRFPAPRVLSFIDYLRADPRRRRLALVGVLTLPSLVGAFGYPHPAVVFLVGVTGVAAALPLVWVRPPRPTVPGWYALVGLLAIVAPLLFTIAVGLAGQLAVLELRGRTVAATVSQPHTEVHTDRAGGHTYRNCFVPLRVSDGRPFAGQVCGGAYRGGGARVDVMVDTWGLASPLVTTEVGQGVGWSVAAVILLPATVGLAWIAGTRDPGRGLAEPDPSAARSA